MAYSEEQRRALLAIARQAVAAAARRQPYRPAEPPDQELRQPRGAFVTLKEGGELRGCIGYVEALYPLYETVARAAAAAAVSDPRFPPVAPYEVDALQLEISVLSPMRPVNDVNEIEVGRHGLVVRDGPCSGLLLPQVPGEWGWDREQFLAHTCLKAGLPRDAWQHGAELYCFEAEVFGEEKLEA